MRRHLPQHHLQIVTILLRHGLALQPRYQLRFLVRTKTEDVDDALLACECSSVEGGGGRDRGAVCGRCWGRFAGIRGRRDRGAFRELIRGGRVVARGRHRRFRGVCSVLS